jgi:protein required for attachment to host cells
MFAQRIAQALHARQVASSFDRLVVVAPATTMGDLRTALSGKVKAVVIAELVADLTNTPVSELPAHLPAHIAL